MPFRFLSVLVLIACASAAHTQTVLRFKKPVDVPVIAISATEFEVVRAAFTAPANLWCAAGTYAQRVLGRETGDLWVAQGLAPSASGKSMIFSTQPISPETTTYTFTLDQAGVRKSLAAALGACDFFETQVFVKTAQGTIRAR